MTDMSQFIAPKSDQLNSDDLISGPRTIRVTKVSENGGGSVSDQPVNVFFDGDGNKPFRPCKSMRRVMVAIWGKDAAQYVGRRMTLYRDPDVTWGGMKVGGIRISHMSHMKDAVVLALTATQKQRKPYRVEPLADEPAPQTQAPDPAVLAAARAAAANGTDAFRKWFKDNPDKRATANTIIEELKAATVKADEEVTDNADPFGLPPVSDTPRLTPEEEATIQREIAERNARDSVE